MKFAGNRFGAKEVLKPLLSIFAMGSNGMIKKIGLLLLLSGIALPAWALDAAYSGFFATANGLAIPYNRFTIFVLPGSAVDLTVKNQSGNHNFAIAYSDGNLIAEGRCHWKYIAPPKKGNYLLNIRGENPDEKMLLNVFVMVPATAQKGQYLNGYRIGRYPEKPYRNNPAYKKPRGFIEVTEENQDLPISPHFYLRQFLCKQQPAHWPKYMVLDPKLILKLELLLEKLNQKGLAIHSLFIMSGYRTPFYNALLGRGIYSRHIYGDAADIYVDTNHDGVIDDLNRDGKADMADAVMMADIIESMDENPKYLCLLGGLGKYKKTSAHTWDIHVDTRGYKARW